jgi:hypothetical protein
MSKIVNLKLSVWIIVIVATISGIVFYTLNKDIKDILGWSKIIFSALGFTATAVVLFDKFLWKLKIFYKWLVLIPNIEGVWTGFLKSDWVNPKTNKRVPKISCQISVTQTLSQVNVIMTTGEMKSYSQQAQIVYNSDTKETILFYNYISDPKATVRHRNKMHKGTALLQYLKSKGVFLKGGYWTDRKTIGDIELEYKSMING